MAVDSTLRDTIMTRYDAADRYLTKKRPLWDEYEDILHSKLSDQLSGNTKSQVYDPMLSTLTFDRSYRVMAQLATGKVKPMSKNDDGAAALMNLALDKYVIPNANAQFDFLTKCRMVDAYSGVYGNFFVLVDWDVKKNGYVGPDMWLIPIRDVFPQVGAMSVKDSEHIIIRTWRPIEFFERMAGNKEFKNVSEIVRILKMKSDEKQSRNAQQMSRREQQEYPTGQPGKGDGFFEVLSMFEGDRWVDFCPGAELDFRDRANPHENGELPIVGKNSIPLIDDFMGLGDFERGKTMQYATNSLWNLYFDAVKVSIFPPVMFDKNAIADKSSIKWSAAAKWFFKGNPQAAAQVMNLTPQGIQVFNQTMGAVKGSILNMFGTSDTTLTSQQDPGFGKTPQALKMQSARENARDNADRYYMEQFVTEVNRKFVNLLAKKGDKVQFRMFDDEIKQLSKQYPEVKDMYDEKTGKLTVDSKKTGSVIYDYEIVSGSTFATDQEKQQQNLVEIFKSITQNLQVDQSGEVSSPLIQALKADNKTIDIGEMLTRIISNSGIQDWDKIILDNAKTNPNGVLDDHMNKFKAALMAISGAPGQHQIPPTPGLPQAGGNPIAGPQGAPQIQGVNAAAAQGTGGVVPHEVVNIKDVPAWAQEQMLAQAGIVPPQGQQMQQQPQVAPQMPQNLPPQIQQLLQQGGQGG